MHIFDDIERANVDAAGHLIGQFDYLNTSARPEAARVRFALEGMLERYPASHQANIISRIRSRDNTQHHSAVFELVLHDFLIAQRHRILEIEPEQPNGRSPDFLVEDENGNKFYLEATIALGDTGVDPGADSRVRDVMDAVDKVHSPDFFLSVHRRGAPANPVAIKQLRRQIQKFVDDLNYEEVIQAVENNSLRPIYLYDQDGFHLRIEVVPKNTRGREGRAIGVQTQPAAFVAPHTSIRSAVEGKAGRYGSLDLPYIIAVNAFDTYANEESSIDALFGSPGVTVHMDGSYELTRSEDGALRGRGGRPVYTRVSAVLSTERLSAWDLGQRPARLILNPWAEKPLQGIPFSIDTWQADGDRLVKRTGISLREVFGLPPRWPEE